MTRRKPHGPGCRACADPEQLIAWLAHERARAAELGEAARQLRAAGEEAGRRHLAATIAGEPHQTLVALQGEHLGLCATANAYAQRALLIRGHVDRVEVTHPAPAAAEKSRIGKSRIRLPSNCPAYPDLAVITNLGQVDVMANG
mgnify:CR=1 FL=1